jgi:hypothetical protein
VQWAARGRGRRIKKRDRRKESNGSKETTGE